MDVKALYSSIPHSAGIKAGKILMTENGFTSMKVSNVTKIIGFILAQYYFESNDKSFIQTQGTAIWKKRPQHMQTYSCGTLKNIY